MSSKKEEIAAFERLKKAFPENDVSLTADLCSWRKGLSYHATVNGFRSTCGELKNTADEAVDLIIEWKKEDNYDQSQG